MLGLAAFAGAAALADGRQMPAVQPLEQLPGTVLPAPVPPSSTWWSVPLPAAPAAAPVIAGERVYVAHLPGIVVAHDLSQGREAWRVQLLPEQPIAADGEFVFVGSGEAVHALSASTGSAAWRRPVGTLTAPLLAKDGWLIAATAQRLSALRAADGTPVWTHASGTQQERAAISGDTLFVPLADGHIEARDLTTGQPKWRRRIGGAPGEPLVAADRLYVGAGDRVLYCLDALSGEIRWRYRVGATVRGRPTTDGRNIYFAALDNVIRALDLRRGWLRWKAGLPFRPLGEPIAAGASVIVAGRENDIRVLAAETGATLTTLPFEQKLAIAPAVAALADRVVVAAVTGGLEESWRLAVAGLPLRPAPIGPAPR